MESCAGSIAENVQNKKRGEYDGMVDGVFGCVFLWGILRRHGDDGVDVGGEEGGRGDGCG